jgi:hypothetical protein
MSLSLTSLLLHSNDVPADARAALRDASSASDAERISLLESAARILYREVDLECSEVRELVGLDTGSC